MPVLIRHGLLYQEMANCSRSSQDCTCNIVTSLREVLENMRHPVGPHVVHDASAVPVVQVSAARYAPSQYGCQLQDFICNEVGNRWWVEALEWERAADWNAALREDWEVDGEKAGTSQVAEPLTFVTVDDAGHMVWCLLTCGDA